MTIQNILNDESFTYIPNVLNLIKGQQKFEKNQMIEHCLKKMLSSTISVAKMTHDQIKKFENDLIETFKFYEWIK